MEGGCKQHTKKKWLNRNSTHFCGSHGRTSSKFAANSKATEEAKFVLNQGHAAKRVGMPAYLPVCLSARLPRVPA